MAYRFLLEVPETLAGDAYDAVAAAEDAQVVVARPSHGLGFEDPYIDLTIAAHTLRVVETLYDWFDDLGASRPDIRIVLHSGERLALEEYDRGALVAAIRRDQPWVERTIPKIGEHETEDVIEAEAAPERAPAAVTPATAATQPLREPAPGAVMVPEEEAERHVAIRDLNHVALRVIDLAKAERFYTTFLDMEILGRARRTPYGGYVALNGSYSWEEAARTGQEADVTFLRNGPLTIALQRLGRSARLEPGLFDHISVRVDATTFLGIKGQVLMRSYEVLASSETAFAFRDPFGVTWEITVQGDLSVM
jgi:catechol 2,3-dioxygenase-like lactoylglutathione lyase family enzyme